ncbi:MAG: hypothetical protein IPK26_23525, partial [Planctomycetes bacterium]|nr:hypothetical protein [Planctomycetota bacterium]
MITMLAIAFELLARLLWTPPDGLAAIVALPLWHAPAPGHIEPLPGFTGKFQEAPPQNLPPSAAFTPRILDIAINNAGLRGDELGDKSATERRILFGGDSLTFGHGVAAAESFPERTAAELTTGDRHVRACNAGVPGFGFQLICRRLAWLRDRTAADALVAAYFLGNDFVDDIEQLSACVVAGRMFQGGAGNLMQNHWRGRFAVRCRAWLFVESWLLQEHASWSLVHALLEATPEQAMRRSALPTGKTIGGLFLDAEAGHAFAPGVPPVVSLWLQDLESSLIGLRATAAGRPLLVLVLPTRFHVDAKLRASVLAESGLDARLLQLGSAQRRIVDLCARLGLDCFDATPTLAGMDAG